MSISLSRAFTNRRAKNASGSDSGSRFAIGSKDSKGGSPALRAKISGPMHLIHTTNMLSYSAPDIPRSASTSKSTISSGSSLKSDDESDGIRTAASSPPTSPDVPQDESCSSPEPNHLSSYFVAPQPILEPATLSTPETPVEPPVIPRRAPSHTKKASFEALARSRSISQMSRDTVSTKASSTFSRASSTSTNSSSSRSGNESYSKPASKPSSTSLNGVYSKHSQSQPQTHNEPSAVATSPADLGSHPFGQELAQVSEIAEEYGVKERLDVIDKEERELQRRGLCKFSADVYIADIDGLLTRFLPEVKRVAKAPTTTWI